MIKSLYLLRHAKAEPARDAESDHERQLTPKGRGAARRSGELLRERGWVPDLAACSTARRARETLELLEEGIGKRLDTVFSNKLYLTSPNEILAYLAGMPEEAGSVLVVGHNPGIQQLAVKLSRHGDEDMIAGLALRFPTSALAVIDLGETARDRIREAHGTLRDYLIQKAPAEG